MASDWTRAREWRLCGVKQALIVGLGGFLGSICRYKLGGFVLHHTPDWRFPLGTFAVNVLGCFAIGVLAGLAEHHDWFSSNARLFVFTGILGGFTTFSAFGYESVNLFRRGDAGVAIAYVALSVFCGVAAVWVGLRLPSLAR